MKLKYLIYLLVLLLGFSVAFAQGETRLWYFGNKAGLDFSSGSAVAVFDGQLSATEGCATISDANGNLLFYTNGITVWNRFHVPMQNGTGLMGDFSSTQSAAIVKKPGGDNQYYIFTTSPYQNGGLRYSTVDVSANGGLGQITAKNILVSDSTCEKIAVVRDSNRQDVWVLSHLLNSNAFRATKITQSGVETTSVTSYVGSTVTADADYANAIGYLKFSADGTQLVACHTFMDKAELFDFNAATGKVSNPRELISDVDIYGSEFSPDSSKLYLSSVSQNKIFQFDLEVQNPANSKTVVATLPTSPGALQLAPDGKIYIAMPETDKLSVIENPDREGLDCALAINAVNLDGRLCMLGLPSFDQSLLYSKVLAGNLCIGSVTEFGFETGFAPDSIHWDFGDGQTAAGNSPTHQYVVAGNYTVKVTAIYQGGSISRTKDLSVLALPMMGNLTELTACDGWVRDGKSTFDLDAAASVILGETIGTVEFYLSEIDALEETHPISGQFTNTSPDQVIFAKLKNAGGCQKIAALTLKVRPCLDQAESDIFPKFFTPNGDGHNDVWQLKADLGTPDFRLDIFDRFGRHLKTITQSDPEWNGTYGGRDLPSDDYWFVLSGENIQEFRSHFSLKR